MMLVQVVDVVGGGLDHLGTFGEDHALQHVDDLGDVGHNHPVAVLVEDIQMESRYHGVPHGVLLIQEAGVGAGLHAKPGAPFVHNQAYSVFGIVLVHDSQVAVDQLFHPLGLHQSDVVHRTVEVQSTSLDFPTQGVGVVVEGDGVHELAGHLHHAVGPVVVVDVGAAGDLKHPVVPVVAHKGAEPAEQVAVIFRAHIAAAAPVFVADAEVLHLPGLFPAVGFPQLGHRGNPVEGHVLHPLAHFLDSAGTHVAVDIGFAAQLVAELHELMGAEGVVLHHPAPVGVHHPLAAFFGADAVLPVVLVGKAAAGPAQHRNFNFL